MHILRGTVEHQVDEKARTLIGDDRTHRAGVADVRADATHPLQQPSDSIASITTSMTALAIGPPPKVVPEAIEGERVATCADIKSAAHGKPLPSAFAVVIMSGITS